MEISNSCARLEPAGKCGWAPPRRERGVYRRARRSQRRGARIGSRLALGV